MISAGSPGSTSTTANTTTVARARVTSAAASRRARKSIIIRRLDRSLARRGGVERPCLPQARPLDYAALRSGRRLFPVDARIIAGRARRVLPHALQLLLPDADLGELVEV